MKYKNRNIYIWKCIPFAQGFVINSKRIIIELVKAKNDKRYVHIPSTCDLIQHEEQHCEDIETKGWIDFFATEGWQLIWKKHDVAGYEPNAERAELNPNPTELEQLIINYCNSHNLLYYY